MLIAAGLTAQPHEELAAAITQEAVAQPPELYALAQPAVNVAPAQIEIRYTPFDAVELAYTDAQAAGANAIYYQYFSLHNIPIAHRFKVKQTFDWVINSLSRRRLIVQSTLLLKGKDPLVLRIDIRNYKLDPKIMDQVIEQGSGSVPLNEPYFYIAVEEKVVETWPATATYAAGSKTVVKKTIRPAPWTLLNGGKAMNGLRDATQRKSPIIRADWAIAYFSWANAYYQLLGLTDKEDEFDNLVSFDAVRALKNRVCAVADTKKVTLHNRILERVPTVSGYVGGYKWSSYDTNNGIRKNDYFNNLDTFDDPDYQAKELIATIANNLQAYAVVNKQRKLLQAADINIARHSDDLPTKLNDKQVFTGLRNCAFCHWGIQPIEDRVRLLASGPTGLSELFGSNPKFKDTRIMDKIIDAFSPPLQPLVLHDNALYAGAVSACNGLAPKVNSNQFEQITWEYLDEDVTLEKAAREVGCSEDKIREVVRASVGIDHTLIALTKQPPIPVERKQFERRGFPQLALLINGLPLPTNLELKKDKD